MQQATVARTTPIVSPAPQVIRQANVVDRAATAVQGLADFAVGQVKSVVEGLTPVAKAIVGAPQREMAIIDQERKALDDRAALNQSLYKAGKITKDQFASTAREIGDSYSDLSKQSSELQTQGANDLKVGLTSIGNTAATILSAGSYAPIATGLRTGAQVSRVIGRVVSDNSRTAVTQVANIMAKAVPVGPKTMTGVEALAQGVRLEGATVAERVVAYPITTTTAPILRQVAERSAGILSNRATLAAAKASLQKIEDMAGKVPAVRALMERNGAKFARSADRGLFEQSLKDAAVGALFKYPFIYHATVEDVHTIYDDINDGNVQGAVGRVAFLTTLAFDGGIFGIAGKGSKALGRMIQSYTTRGVGRLPDITLSAAIKNAALGRASFLDNLASSTADGSPRAWKDWLERPGSPKDIQRRTDALRVMQEMNLRRWDDDVNMAVQGMVDHYNVHMGFNLSRITFEEVMDREVKYISDYRKLEAQIAKGKIMDKDGNVLMKGQVALGSLSREAREEIAGRFALLKSKESRVAYIEAMRENGVFWAQNEIMYAKMVDIATSTRNVQKLTKRVMDVDTGETLVGIPNSLKKALAKDGYVAIRPVSNELRVMEVEDTRNLVTSLIDEGDDAFELATAPMPSLNMFTVWMKRVGLSPVANNHTANKALRESVAGSLAGTRALSELTKRIPSEKLAQRDLVPAAGGVIMKLQRYIENKRPLFENQTSLLTRTSSLTDIRQMSTKEIREALNSRTFKVSRDQAVEIQRAIRQGYIDVPLEMRGLGDRAVDALFRYVPGAAAYNRFQASLRYTYNPFFRTQEVVETQAFAKLEANTLLWGRTKGQLDNTVATLERMGVFSEELVGNAAMREDVVIGRITSHLLPTQKRQLAGLAETIAQRKGMAVADYAARYPDELADALKVIVQYPTRGALATPLARTINLAFWPMRYNIKVASMTAKILARQSPTVQYAVINSAFKVGDWLKSDEGLAWQAQYSGAIGFLRWVTPFGTIQQTLTMLRGNTASVSDLGQLGGLPFGFIFQLLDSYRVFDSIPGITYATPYVDPKTGEIYSDRVPKTLKGYTAMAIEDFINHTFTYPGRIVGLPGKGAIVRRVSGVFVDTNGSDYERIVREDKLTELQKRQAEIIKSKNAGDYTEEELLTLYTAPSGLWSTPSLSLLFGVPVTDSQTQSPLQALAEKYQTQLRGIELPPNT